MWGHMEGWGPGAGWWMLGHALWWLLVVAGLVVCVVFVLRALDRRPAQNKVEEDRALTVLRERFARGEIDEAEFQERKRVLGR